MTRSNSSSSSSEGEQPSVDVANKQAASPEVLPTDETSRSPSEGSQRGRARPTRPKLTSRKSSGPIVVPRNHIHTEEEIEYPPDDARAMSPRRNSQETEAMEEATRSAVRQHARQVQLNLLEIAESIELVKADHDKLEKQNLALQDYIGGLTRSMSRSSQTKNGKGKAK